MKTDAFSDLHPAVNFTFFAGVIGMTMFIMHPACLAISLACGCLYLVRLQGGRGTGRQVGYLLPLLLGMALLNPLFSHGGNTVLLQLPWGKPVTLEALCYGLASAAMMGASILWFNCCSVVFTSDKIICLFSRVIPSLSLLVSMTLRFIPRFKTFLQTTLEVQRALHPPASKKEQLSLVLTSFSATVSWAMEQSIVSSDSMRSRGYGLEGRTAFSIYRFTRRDGWALGGFLLLCLGACLPHFTGDMAWEYLPAMGGTALGLRQLLALGCYGGACLLPLIIDWEEDRKWNSLK